MPLDIRKVFDYNDKQHKTIRMAKRIESKSIEKFSSKNLTDEERNQQFISRIANEWVFTPDGDPWENPNGVECVCGRPVKREYWVCKNIMNGNVIKLGETCMKYIKDKVLLEKDFRNKLEQKLYQKKKSAFINMSDYVQRVLISIIDTWTLDNCIKYLATYQDNETIRGILIDNIIVKNIKRHKKFIKAKENVKFECMKRNEAVADMKIYKMENKKLNEKIKQLEKELKYKKMFENEPLYSSDSD